MIVEGAEFKVQVIIEEPPGKCELCGAIEETRPYGPQNTYAYVVEGRALATGIAAELVAFQQIPFSLEYDDQDGVMQYIFTVPWDQRNAIKMIGAAA